MFSFFRLIYRRLFIWILLYYYSFVEFVSSIDDKRIFHETHPFRNNSMLREYAANPYETRYLTHPLTSRCTARKFGDHYLNIEDIQGQCAEELNEKSRPKVLVCHDMAGGYHGDRFVTGSKKYDDYRFYHWAGIDYFNYFTHNYITIPPIPWINAGHRNGVLVLGTFITEGSDGTRNLDEVLKSEQSVDEITDALVLLTKNFGFDGWLLNIESSVSSEQVPLLKFFNKILTKKIHDEIPYGKVIWYDSVVESGSVSWQNEVNEENIKLYEGTDGILLNYWWSDSSLQSTAKILNNDPVKMQEVFVGIDVFGRNQVAKFHTHETLRQIKDYNFSVGIFAPGWTFENMPNMNPFAEKASDNCNDMFLSRNNRFWGLLWKYLYSRGPNTLPFYTSFCMGSGKRQYRDGLAITNEPFFNLMEQEYQPSVPSLFSYHFNEAYRGGSCIRFNDTVENIRLFVTDFKGQNDIVVSYVYKRSDPTINVTLILNVEHEERKKNILVYCKCDANNVSNVNSIVKKQKIREHHLTPMNRSSLKPLLRGLSVRDEKTFPSTAAPVNGWETRYFYLNFDESARSSRIVDIGLSVQKDRWENDDTLLFGALHVHDGIENSHWLQQQPEANISFANWDTQPQEMDEITE